MRIVGEEYPQPQVGAASTGRQGRNFLEILFNKTRMDITAIKIIKTRTAVKRGVITVPSVTGEILTEQMFEAAPKAKDTMVPGKSPTHKQIPPSTAMGAHIHIEFSFK